MLPSAELRSAPPDIRMEILCNLGLEGSLLVTGARGYYGATGGINNS